MNIEVKNTIKPINYAGSMKILEKRVQDVLFGEKEEFLWILEHKTVYTAGTSANEKDLIDKNLSIFNTNRGGRYTVHSPGQKVIYFVLNLNKRKRDIRMLINNIESCIMDILREFKIKSYPDRDNIGIWVKSGNNSMKIAAIGIRVKKWIAYHGFTLNVSNDLTKYKKIIPCGIKDKGITSLKNMGIKNYKNINEIIARKFLSTFLLGNL